MKMRETIKILLIAVVGGVSALGVQKAFFSEKVINYSSADHGWNTPAMNASFVNGMQENPGNFTEAAESSVHSVVHILTEFTQKSSVYDNFFSIDDFFFGPGARNRTIQATGSGVIISSDGYIVTNNHVVQEATKVTITLNDKRVFIAKVIGTDPSTDLALLKIEADKLPFMVFGNSDELKVGEWVLAVGNPFNLTSTVTAGIVSAKARNINILGSNSAIESFIQTDAVVNKGNSGGALVDTKGKLIGINAAIASGTGYYEGYSFAIPSMIVSKVVKDLRDYGKVQRAFLGVTIQEMNDKLMKSLKLNEIKGLYVEYLYPGGSAENGGIQKGDILLQIDDKQINSQSELLEQIGRKHPGDKIIVKVRRGEKLKDIDVILSSSNGKTSIDAVSSNPDIMDKLGVEFTTTNEATLTKLGLKNGVTVSKVADGMMKNAGIQAGFIITRVDKIVITTPDELVNIFKTRKGGLLVEGVYPNGIRAFYGFGL